MDLISLKNRTRLLKKQPVLLLKG